MNKVNISSNRLSDSHPKQSWLITKIEPSQKGKERWAIFLDDEYSFSVTEETLLKFNIKVGQSLTAKQLEVIESHDLFELAKRLTMRYLGLRVRSEKEVIDYLKKKRVPLPIIARVLTYCRDNKYLDDHTFATAFVRDKLNLSKDGILKIRHDLHQKGIKDEIIDEVFKKLYNEEDQIQKAYELAKKKSKTGKPDRKECEKLIRYLMQKGYTFDEIKVALQRLVNQ